jgi:hypothetical protein
MAEEEPSTSSGGILSNRLALEYKQKTQMHHCHPRAEFATNVYSIKISYPISSLENRQP